MNLHPKGPHKLHPAIWLVTFLGGTLAAVVLLAEYGFGRPLLPMAWSHGAEITATVILLAGTAYAVVIREPRVYLRNLIFDLAGLVVMGVLLLVLPSLLQDFSIAVVRWHTFQVYLLMLVVMRVGRFLVRAATFGRAPGRVLLGSFACLIIMGAALLMLPASHRGTASLSVTDAVFTATSATCVTGLIVKDTGGDFTRLGQTIILTLIQIGGLGIMIFGALFALLLGSSLSLRESAAVQDIIQQEDPGRVGSTIVFIFLFSFLFEALGTLALYGSVMADSARSGRLFTSIFHSISAFCNAGFSLQSSSLQSYRETLSPYLIICPLIIIGGLGFPVLHNLAAWLRQRSVQLRQWFQRGPTITNRRGGGIVRLSLQSKIVLTTTATLLVVGWILLVVLQLTRPDGNGESWGAVSLDALFNTITARTAGFNTVDISQLSAGAKLVMILLMVVGGSPGSTAGGLKTVTLAILVLSIAATIRRRRQVQAFHRSIPLMVVRRVATITILYGLSLWVITLLLTITEHSSGTNMLDLLFEATSALGTVGLSTGVTAQLTTAGKWVIIGAMFVGRLGPLSLLAALSFNTPPVSYEYPTEPLVVS